MGFPGGSAVKNPLANAGVMHLPLHWDDPLGRSSEKEIETNSSVPTWEIPWTEKPGRLQSMGLERVG